MKKFIIFSFIIIFCVVVGKRYLFTGDSSFSFFDLYHPSDEVLRVEGNTYVGNTGELLTLTGMNVGQWLSLEGYLWEVGEHTRQTYREHLSDRDIRERLATVLSSTNMSVDTFMDEYRTRFFTQEDVAYVKSLGITVLRIPFSEKDIDTSIPYMDQVLSWCNMYEIYCLFDLHTANLPQSTYSHSDYREETVSWWKNADAQQHTIDALLLLAERYNENPWLAGFDILNEPQSPSDAALQTWYARAITALRTQGFMHLIFIQPNNVSLDVAAIMQADSGVVYAPHYYGTSGRMMDEHKEVFSFKDEEHHPLFIGETGNWANDAWAAYTDVFVLYGYRSAHVPFAYWNYKDMISDNQGSFGLVRGNITPEWNAFRIALETKTPLPTDVNMENVLSSFVTTFPSDRPAVIDLFRQVNPDTVINIFTSMQEVDEYFSQSTSTQAGRRGQYLWQMSEPLAHCNGITVRECFSGI
ncbi:MAG: glycoside hydrolase family 5 protein [Candidatus Magasanikbacteria bacterium]|uniref:Glycoside hydrolase family 5 domain-containing protein n=1 Tax=Candidatus Magasanikbacteria bacterium CG10_big_fil_rev_8_21_14_0_10_38_6 TaxID=1974647 RepID=A0A2M6P047_9BACT|nr:glycoside hydrolase family 5 protein [Candidatus Magasanikbacteria bacterium]PIR77071.1 MAG: hypothetical protein COU30_04425 [Candidatus Magasanikbacteria bacterium CG10_big_fil_rev_8_21_14_0_10_38_6]